MRTGSDGDAILTQGGGGPETALLATDDRGPISYAELQDWVSHDRALLRQVPTPRLAFQFSPNSAAAVAAYLACLAESVPLGLGEPATATRDRVLDAYVPNALLLPAGEPPPEHYELIGELAGGELTLWCRRSGYAVTPHPKLALMLATSGSTGDAKFVRLTLDNLVANARAIVQYLELGPGEIAIQSLPLHYSYGLSVLNSHLLSGGTVALTKHSFMRREFWRAVDEHRCTSFAGVPYMYETLRRLRLNPAQAANVRTLTQAGGHLRPETVEHFNASARSRGGRMFVMYGQTEATARISYVPPERLAAKAGSIGIAIPGGRLWLQPVEGEPNHQQLFYGGSNVMMGYAIEPADLAKGDELGGVLATGDIAECDGDGFFRLTGRLARIAKLFGKRINLASVEAEIERMFSGRAAVTDGGDQLKVFLEGCDRPEAVQRHLAGLLAVPPAAIKPVAIARLPMTASGKKDYKSLS